MNLADTLIQLISLLVVQHVDEAETQTATFSKHTSNRTKESQAADSDANLFPARQQQGPSGYGTWNPALKAPILHNLAPISMEMLS